MFKQTVDRYTVERQRDRDRERGGENGKLNTGNTLDMDKLVSSSFVGEHNVNDIDI